MQGSPQEGQGTLPQPKLPVTWPGTWPGRKLVDWTWSQPSCRHSRPHTASFPTFSLSSLSVTLLFFSMWLHTAINELFFRIKLSRQLNLNVKPLRCQVPCYISFFPLPKMQSISAWLLNDSTQSLSHTLLITSTTMSTGLWYPKAFRNFFKWMELIPLPQMAFPP